MKASIKDSKKAGIYCIRNIVNNKVYIGKSIDIHTRIKRHISYLNIKSVKHENQYLINSWHKYGKNNFIYFVLEYLEKDDIILSERELYWIKIYDSLNKEKGYNFRLDSSGKCIVSEQTRKKCSESGKLRYKNNPQEKEKTSKFFKKFWKENPDKLESMKSKIKTNNHKYKILQYDKFLNLIRKWKSVEEIIQENPTYKWQNIYSVCNGYKPTIYGYIWRKESKI